MKLRILTGRPPLGLDERALARDEAVFYHPKVSVRAELTPHLGKPGARLPGRNGFMRPEAEQAALAVERRCDPPAAKPPRIQFLQQLRFPTEARVSRGKSPAHSARGRGHHLVEEAARSLSLVGPQLVKA